MIIYKIILPSPGKAQIYTFPANSRPLIAQMQSHANIGEEKVAWILLEETQALEMWDYEFILVGTGWKLDSILTPEYFYLGTIQEYQYIWHVFYRIIKGENK